jgi:hypothetical protein
MVEQWAQVLLLEQPDELITGKASALDYPQHQPTPQIAAVPRHDHAATVAGTV